MTKNEPREEETRYDLSKGMRTRQPVKVFWDNETEEMEEDGRENST